MVTYTDSLDGITADSLGGFFEGWPDPPSPEEHLCVLSGSDHVWLAVERPSGRVVGFITAISDGVMNAHIPLLEVLPEWQGRGIGSELVRRMVDTLGGHYAIDLMCDEDVQPFYGRLGFSPMSGMGLRRRAGVP